MLTKDPHAHSADTRGRPTHAHRVQVGSWNAMCWNLQDGCKHCERICYESSNKFFKQTISFTSLRVWHVLFHADHHALHTHVAQPAPQPSLCSCTTIRHIWQMAQDGPKVLWCHYNQVWLILSVLSLHALLVFIHKDLFLWLLLYTIAQSKTVEYIVCEGISARWLFFTSRCQCHASPPSISCLVEGEW